MDAPFLLERDHNSVTIAWLDVDSKTAKTFELEICEEGDWRSLSKSISTTSVRKKNLKQAIPYLFRVRSQTKGSTTWSPFSISSDPVTVLPATTKLLEPPTLRSKDSQSLTVQWTDDTSRDGYSLRYRTETNNEWQVIASVLQDKVVRKKGLLPGCHYFFSVRPVGGSEDYDYSLSSLPFTVPQLSQYLSNLLPAALHTPQWPKLTPTADLLAGKVVAVYFSAHWCGPCRSFTPKLSEVYRKLKSASKEFEIIFCSADHSESEFESYYKEMPFLAIPYDDEKRESFMGLFKVSGIPRLVVLAPSGRILVDNAAGQDISMQTIDSWISQGSKM
jgi:thiol-disulfide isomerase/thioredoxin